MLTLLRKKFSSKALVLRQLFEKEMSRIELAHPVQYNTACYTVQYSMLYSTVLYIMLYSTIQHATQYRTIHHAIQSCFDDNCSVLLNHKWSLTWKPVILLATEIKHTFVLQIIFTALRISTEFAVVFVRTNVAECFKNFFRLKTNEFTKSFFLN